MRSLRRLIGQIAEASAQLARHHPTSDRLALILVDNAVELLVYDRVRRIFAWDAMLRTIEPRKFPRKKREEVLRDFGQMVNLVVSNPPSSIPGGDGQIFRAAHLLRNEAYHQGLMRETILGPVARTYLAAACRCLPELWSGSYSMTDWREVDDFLRAYGLDGGDISRQSLGAICRSLVSPHECSTTELAEALEADLTGRIERLRDGVDTLSAALREPPDDALKSVQFAAQFDWPDDVTEMPVNDEEAEAFLRRKDTAYVAFRPRVTLKRLSDWNARATRLLHSRSAGQAMESFSAIDRHLIKVEKCVWEAVAEYEDHIEAEMEHRRLGELMPAIPSEPK